MQAFQPACVQVLKCSRTVGSDRAPPLAALLAKVGRFFWVSVSLKLEQLLLTSVSALGIGLDIVLFVIPDNCFRLQATSIRSL